MTADELHALYGTLRERALARVDLALRVAVMSQAGVTRREMVERLDVSAPRRFEATRDVPKGSVRTVQAYLTELGRTVEMSMSAEAQELGTPRSGWDALMANLENLGRVAAGLAAIVAVLYVVGAVVIGVRLGVRDLPSTAVVAQLPREFLLSTGLNVILPFPAAVVAVYVSGALARNHVSALARKQGGATARPSGARVARNAIALAALAALISAGYYIWKEPFPAKVCSPAGDTTAVGDFIGETGQRVYIGERRDPAGRRRIASLPVAGVGQVLIGGGAHEQACADARSG